ncbi:MAG: hypothetical protein FJ284_13660, partial [Planctomycetes bacterium]|nr:hypothetical protein [Planctomycetota bacterium]
MPPPRLTPDAARMGGYLIVTWLATGGWLWAAEPTAPTHEIRDVVGWKLHVSRRLLAEQPEETARAVQLLERQLAEIVRVVPAAAVERLRATPLWFSPEYSGVPPRAEFHPDAGWLQNNGRDPALARAVEFT